MRKILALLLFILIANNCTAKTSDSYKYTGYEINKKFTKIQKLTLNYEVENGGPIYNDEISIYKTNKNLCAIVSKIDGDSGIYGTERILYFNNLKFRSGYIHIFGYVFLDNDETKKTNKTRYIELINDAETQKKLQNDFKNYLKKMNKNTLGQCS